MRAHSKRCRKATWTAFALVALAAASRAARDVEGDVDAMHLTTGTATVAAREPGSTPQFDSRLDSDAKEANNEEHDASAEASRAYRHAMTVLSTLTALPPTHSPEPALQHPSSLGNAVISRFLPSIQGHGPIASAMRILVKLRNKSWLPRFLSSRASAENSGRKKQDTLRAVKVVDLLTHAAELGHTEALYALAKLYLIPPTQHFSTDLPAAYRYFDRHAAATGNASSQAYLAFFHATGYDDIVPVDQAKAQLYYTFAAHGGDKGAQMALGYRYWSGIAVTEDCGRAVEWYELAAEQAMKKFVSGPPGGRTMPLTTTRLSDLDGGVFGPGASVASTGLNSHRPAIKAARARIAGETWEDILEYYMFNADRGETDFMFRLGKIYYHGSIYNAPGGIASGGEGVSRVPRDYERARYYFERIARTAWPSDPLDPLQHQQHRRAEDQQQHVGYAAAAAGFLGRMYLRGEGVRQDFKRARMWFERGAEHMEKECHNGLGIIWRDGLVDGKKDMRKAITHFSAAAGQELPEAQVNMGKFHYQKGEIQVATAYFESAVRHGSPFEAYFYLAQIHARSLAVLPPSMRPGACSMAASFFKVAAERGAWGDNLLAAGDAAWAHGAQASALLLWALDAERGREAAQNNVAYVLDPDRSMMQRGRAQPAPAPGAARRALAHWTRSAAQNNVDALVKVADYHYHGVGVPAPDRERAAGYYRSAADTQVSALAMWNLGWMYENGVGVPQDFHLAKRYYDVALETNQEAYLPVTLALFKLYARSAWHTLTGGAGGLNLWAPDELEDGYAEQPPRQELDGGGDAQTEQDDGFDLGGEDDGYWYLGRARDEFNRRRRGADATDDDDDPVLWAYERRREELARDGDFGPEDYFDGALRGGAREPREDGGDEFFETMVLVALCVVVSLLLYVRGRLVERLRREERQQRQQQQQQPPQQQQQQGAGLFPPQDDPARDDWAVQR